LPEKHNLKRKIVCSAGFTMHFPRLLHMITATRGSLNFTKTPQTSQRLVPSTNYLTSQYVDCPSDQYQRWATSFCLQSRLRSTCSIYLILCGWPNETQLL